MKQEKRQISLATRRFTERGLTRVGALLMIVALLSLPWIFKLDGKQHANWEQFLGRLHPLAVHLPIGLLVLIPLLEIGGLYRPALREAAGFVLGLGFVACMGTLSLGYLLAYGSGSTGATVTRHMWGGIALSIGVLLCLLTRPAWSSGTVTRIYPTTLICVLLALVWTAHQGGSLTHGSNYLTEYMPARIKSVFAMGDVPSSVPSSNSFYAMHINPIFDANCIACHGAGKTDGGLRLDSYDLLMKGGKDGAVIMPNKPERSLLLQRVTLPPDNKHFMPAEGHPPLKQQEIGLIRAWIQQGASPAVAMLAGISIPEESKEPPPQPVGDYSALMTEIHAMQQGQGAKLVPVSSKPSDGLVLNTVDVASSFGDTQLATFQKFAPYIVEAELGRTAVTDASFGTLSSFKHLRALHLEGTAVTGSELAKLAPLNQLTYLNLSGTKVTATALSPLISMKNLRHVYTFDTPAQQANSTAATQPAARSIQ